MRAANILRSVPVVLFAMVMLPTVIEIIDATGDGTGNILDSPSSVAGDS